MLVGLRRWLSPSDGGNRPLPEPVGQRPATNALHEVGALAQPPAGRGGLVTRLGAAGGRSNAQPATGAATVTSAS